LVEPTSLAAQASTLLVYGMLATAILLMAQKTLPRCILIYALQTALLAGIALVTALATGHLELLFIAGITLVFKVGLVTRLLLRVMARIQVRREVDPLLGIPASVLLVILLTGMAFAFTSGIPAPAGALAPDALPVSLAITFAGIAAMATRSKAMIQAVGLLMAENGAFLAAVSLTYGMPLLVEMGVFFDVLTVSIVLGIFVFRISETFASIDTTNLRRLVD